jgi:hypothetical protein
VTRRPRRLVTPGWGNPYRVEVGRRLREVREAAGLSQRKLATRVSPVTKMARESVTNMALRFGMPFPHRA